MNKYEQEIADQFISMVKAFMEPDPYEEELFKLCKEFTEKTGGKMSPYQSPEPVVVSVIKIRKNNGELGLLGVRRAIAPKIGEVAFPGGFVNKKENACDANCRELSEECPGFVSMTPDMFSLLCTEITPSNQLLLFYVSNASYPESSLAQIQKSPEVLEVCLIGPDTPLAFPLHAKIRDRVLADL